MSSFRWLGVIALISLTGCPDAEGITPPTAAPVVDHSASFVGFMYDGATGARIDTYTLDVQVADTALDGAVDADGRYLVGPISVWDDFTVLVGVDGYRPFRSHNAHVGLPAELAQSDDIADISTHQTLHFDAYLFPSQLQAPAVTFTIATATGDSPTGTARLRPIGKSLLADDTASETPSGVPGQLWDNDEDLQAQALSRAFSDGQLAIAAGELVYGVTYQVSIYDVPGFQPLEDTYTAGVETNKTFDLAEEVAEPLQVIQSTINSCLPPSVPNAMSGAIVTVQFNQNVEEAESGYPGGAAEALDDGLSMSSPDLDGDLEMNQLDNQADSTTVQEHGVTLDFTGDTMTIAWNPGQGLLAPIDLDDPIVSVTYTGLGNVRVQRVGSPASATALSTLLQATIMCPPP